MWGKKQREAKLSLPAMEPFIEGLVTKIVKKGGDGKRL